MHRWWTQNSKRSKQVVDLTSCLCDLCVCSDGVQYGINSEECNICNLNTAADINNEHRNAISQDCSEMFTSHCRGKKVPHFANKRRTICVFPKIGLPGPKSSMLIGGFHYKPSILGYPDIPILGGSTPYLGRKKSWGVTSWFQVGTTVWEFQVVSLYLPCSLVQPLDESLDSTSVPEVFVWKMCEKTGASWCDGKIKQFAFNTLV